MSAETYDHPFIQSPLSWCGYILMAVGECGNPAAYSMASASLIAPLDAVVIASNVMLSGIVFKERLPRARVIGVVMILLGIVSISLNAPQCDRGDLQYEFDHAPSLRSVIFLSVIFFAATWLANPFESAWGVSQQDKRLNPIYYCSLCGLMGMLTVVGAKSLSIALNKAIINRNDGIFNDLRICLFTYPLFAATVGFVIMQMKYLHIAFSVFGFGVVTSIYYVIFTSLTVSAGMIVFNETFFWPQNHAALFLFGLIIIFAGVFTINKDTAILYSRVELDQRYLTRGREAGGE